MTSAKILQRRRKERVRSQLRRRKEPLDGRWELLMAERDVLDERIWALDPRTRPALRPPQVEAVSAAGPRDLAPESWDFALDGAVAH